MYHGQILFLIRNKYEGRNLQVHMPKNCQSVHLVFRAEKIAKTVGSLAALGPKDGRRIP
jgi:hypothetical protein